MIPLLLTLLLWPQWRGPLGTGEAAPDANPPLTWSETENIRWRTEVPGKGHSTPVVADGRIFLTTAVPAGEPLPKPLWSNRPGAHDNAPITDSVRSIVLAVDFESGEILWQKVVHEGLPHEGGHNTGSLASASPVTDGEHLIAFFGSRGLYGLDLEGKILWSRQLGEMHSKHGHGEASSPALFGDTVVVNWDHEEADDFLVAFDKATGKEKWRTPREEVTSWSSPIIVKVGDQPQVIVAGTAALRGYDLATGKILWSCSGLSNNVVASPLYSQELGMVFAGSSYEKQAFLAVKIVGAEGDLTGTDRVAWRRIRRTPYVPSPLLYHGGLYFFTHYQNVISRVDPATGKDAPGAMRLEGLRNSYASPLGAAGRVYLSDLSGNTLVLSTGEKPEVTVRNQLSDSFAASPVAIEKSLLLRGEKALYRIESK